MSFRSRQFPATCPANVHGGRTGGNGGVEQCRRRDCERRFFLKLDCFLPYNNKISKCETKFPAVQLYPRDLHHRHDHNPWQRGNVLAHFDQRKVSEAGGGGISKLNAFSLTSSTFFCYLDAAVWEHFFPSPILF